MCPQLAAEWQQLRSKPYILEVCNVCSTLPETEAAPAVPSPAVGSTAVVAGTFTPGGEIFYQVCADGTVSGWSARTKKELFGWRGAQPASEVVFSSDVQMVALLLADGTISVHHPASSKSLNRFPAGRTFRALAFAPQGSGLATIDEMGGVSLWSTNTWRESKLASAEPGSAVLSFSPDNALLAVASKESPSSSLPGQRPIPLLSPPSLSNNPTQYLTRIWQLRDGKAIPLRDLAHPDPVEVLRFSQKQSYLAIGTANGVVELWRTSDWVKIGSFLERQGRRVINIAFSTDEKLLLVSNWSGRVKVWDIRICVTVNSTTFWIPSPRWTQT